MTDLIGFAVAVVAFVLIGTLLLLPLLLIPQMRRLVVRRKMPAVVATVLIGFLATNLFRAGLDTVGDFHSVPQPTRAIDDILRSLEWGSIVFSAPERLRFEESSVVRVLLSPKQTESELTEQLRSKLQQMPHRQQIESATVRVSNRMRADLSGPGFDVQPLTPNVQAVRYESPTTWNWSVVPVKSGSKTLYLTVSALVDVAGEDTPITLKTYERQILVVITPRQRVTDFVSKNWQWLWATLLTPAAVYAWKRTRMTSRPAGISFSQRLRELRARRRRV
jgi:hypothetical protein